MNGQEYNEKLVDIVSELNVGEVDTMETVQRIYNLDNLSESMPGIVEDIQEQTGIPIPKEQIEKIVRATFLVAYKNIIKAMNETLCSKNQTN